jgi:beta-phosphoglucomutase-like phosphatase (HAD superfamily)
MATPPERCVVVEDSPFGVIAARVAGMSALGYAADGSGERLASEGARTFGSMVELPGLLASRRSKELRPR